MRDLETTRAAILHVAEELQRRDHRLAWIGKDLPQLQLGQGFSVHAEMRGAIDAVRCELLSDAIATLTSVSTDSEYDLKRRFLSRLLSRIAEGERGTLC